MKNDEALAIRALIKLVLPQLQYLNGDALEILGRHVGVLENMISRMEDDDG